MKKKSNFLPPTLNSQDQRCILLYPVDVVLLRTEPRSCCLQSTNCPISPGSGVHTLTDVFHSSIEWPGHTCSSPCFPYLMVIAHTWTFLRFDFLICKMALLMICIWNNLLKIIDQNKKTSTNHVWFHRFLSFFFLPSVPVAIMNSQKSMAEDLGIEDSSSRYLGVWWMGIWGSDLPS